MVSLLSFLFLIPLDIDGIKQVSLSPSLSYPSANLDCRLASICMLNLSATYQLAPIFVFGHFKTGICNFRDYPEKLQQLEIPDPLSFFDQDQYPKEKYVPS
eukprot:jgi/Psemu1/6721/gm1.6721_g